MSNVVITLGGVTFQDFEVPEKIGFGGTQRVAVHQLIGGGRVVDALGDDAGKISFSGVFSGADAAARAQTLDAATATGAQLPLYWDAFFYDVIIERFQADYAKPWWIPFSIGCVVIVDPVALVAVSAAELIGSDVSAAVALSGQAGLALNVSGAASAVNLAAAQGLINQGLDVSGSMLLSGAARLGAAADAQAGVAGMNEVVTAAGQLGALTCMSGYIGRAASNLANQLL